MGRVELVPLKKAVTFRKVAMGTWDKAMDPSVYGFIDINMETSLNFIREYEEKNQVKISPLHLVAKALAICLQETPEANAMIRFKKVYLRKKVRLFFQVNIPGEGSDKTSKADLAGCCVDEPQLKSLKEIAEALREGSDRIRAGKDKEINRGLLLVKLLPWWLIKYYLNFTSFVIYGLNWNLAFLGFPKDPFGSAMITNVGSLGIDYALAPLCSYTHTPLLIAVGSVGERPWVEEGKVVAKPLMNIGITFDHRVIDGVHAAKMAVQFKEIFANPHKYF